MSVVFLLSEVTKHAPVHGKYILPTSYGGVSITSHLQTQDAVDDRISENCQKDDDRPSWKVVQKLAECAVSAKNFTRRQGQRAEGQDCPGMKRPDIRNLRRHIHPDDRCYVSNKG